MILPHGRVGTNEPDKLVASCHPCQFVRNQWTLEEVGFLDQRDREPVVDDWNGLTRILTSEAGDVIGKAIANGLPSDIDVNGFDVADPDDAELTKGDIQRRMTAYGFDRETVLSLWGPQKA